jgi:7-cyano-7-deazaguanine synthase
MKAILIYSGGLDSTVMLYNYVRNIELAVTFIYGAKHNSREIETAIYNCQFLKIPHRIIDIREVGKNLKSNLIDRDKDIPSGRYDSSNMSKTIVPFRNGIMISITAGIANSEGLDTVMIANHAGDHYIYPDCRPKFIDRMNQAIMLGTDKKVELLAPFTNIDKTQIVKIGYDIGIDFKHTWTCYNGREIHCGVCGSCNERKEAFQLAKIDDPTEYER